MEVAKESRRSRVETVKSHGDVRIKEIGELLERRG